MKQNDIHPEAAEYFGMGFAQSGTDEARVENSAEAMRRTPMFLEVAGPGDERLAADLLVAGTDKVLRFVLDYMMLSAPSFNSKAAHVLFSLEMAHAASMQMQALMHALTNGASHHLAVHVAALPPEEQISVMKRHQERSLKNLIESLGGEDNVTVVDLTDLDRGSTH